MRPAHWLRGLARVWPWLAPPLCCLALWWGAGAHPAWPWASAALGLVALWRWLDASAACAVLDAAREAYRRGRADADLDSWAAAKRGDGKALDHWAGRVVRPERAGVPGGGPDPGVTG